MRANPENEPPEDPAPIYDGSNSYLPKKVDIIRNVLTSEEVEALSTFVHAKFEKVDATTREIELSYRPEDWDNSGVIEKLHNYVREHIKNTFHVEGSLNPRKFMLLRTTDLDGYKEEYGLYNENNEILYTAVSTPTYHFNYFSGQTLYFENGEGFFPFPDGIAIHRNEQLNSWEIQEVINGERLDLIMVFEEIDRKVHYNYEIDQLEDDGIDY